MTPKAKRTLEAARRRPGSPHGLRPPLIYKIIAIGLYEDQIAYLDTLADALKRHKNEPRNRSGAMQWLIEQHMKSEAER